MRIYKVDGYDDLRSGFHHLDREINILEKRDLPETFYQPLFEMVEKMQILAPKELAVVAAVSLRTITKDGPWYLGGTTNTGWEMKAGNIVFDDNHMEFWQRDSEGHPLVRLGDLFYEPSVPLVEAKDQKSLELMVFERMRIRCEQLRNAKRQEVSAAMERIAIEQEQLVVLEDQFLYVEKHLMRTQLT